MNVKRQDNIADDDGPKLFSLSLFACLCLGFLLLTLLVCLFGKLERNLKEKSSGVLYLFFLALSGVQIKKNLQC